MWTDYIILAVIGLSGGFAIAGGVFALITSIGVIPQIADVTHTASYVRSPGCSGSCPADPRQECWR